MSQMRRFVLWATLTVVPSACGGHVGSDISGPSSDGLHTGLDQIDIQRTVLRPTPKGCVLDVTLQNRTGRNLTLGLTYRAFDATGREVASFSEPDAELDSVDPHATTVVTLPGPRGWPAARSCVSNWTRPAWSSGSS